MDPDGGNSSAKGNKKTIHPSDILNGNNPEGDSSLTDPKETIEDELQDFRNKWQKELKISPKQGENSNKSNQESAKESKTQTDEEKAKVFYLTAVDMEKTGEMFEAVKFYKKAFDLVSDIDYKYFDSLKASTMSEDNKNRNRKSDKNKNILKDEDLLLNIQSKISGPICFPRHHQNTTHISALPLELILYILKWVVTRDLDLRSLEMFGQVCRGFYVCARDSEIWKLACYKVWGSHSKLESYANWRQMFLERPRLLFNGCYISKTTYIRHGENSFQDQFYRPWHLISYYRYFRFFPEGKVLMLTTPDEPNASLSQLRTRTPKPPVLSGYYRLKNDRVVITVHRIDNKNNNSNQHFKRNTKREMHSPTEQTFNLELLITNFKSKRHIQLQWTHYSINTKSKGVENVCVFDLVGNKFPPLWFSRVKSYAVESDLPLD